LTPSPLPKKPTQPFGHIAFHKSGQVERKLFQLSDVKKSQEGQALEQFIQAFNARGDNGRITHYSHLPDNDQDFIINLDGSAVYVQLTELVDRSFTFPMSLHEYNRSLWTEAMLKESGQIPWRIDVDKKNAALKELIRGKIEKHYAKSDEVILWLVVFTTCSNYWLEMYDKGVLSISESLRQAREYLRGLTNLIFDEVWFTDMQTRPVQIWPDAAKSRAGF